MEGDTYLWTVGTLEHSGIKGMKWGIRRFQNEDGSLTPAGRERYGVGNPAEGHGSDSSQSSAQPATKKGFSFLRKRPNDGRRPLKMNRKEREKNLKELPDDDLDKAVKRLELEKRYRELTKQEREATMSLGRKMIGEALGKAGQNALNGISNYVIGSAVNKLYGADVVSKIPKKHEDDDDSSKSKK